MSTLSILLEKTLINLKKEINDPKNTELIDSIIEPIIHKIIYKIYPYVLIFTIAFVSLFILMFFLLLRNIKYKEPKLN